MLGTTPTGHRLTPPVTLMRPSGTEEREGWADYPGWYLQSPDRVQFFRRPELEQGQTRFTKTATILLHGMCPHGLPCRNQEAPARSRWSRAVKRQRAV